MLKKGGASFVLVTFLLAFMVTEAGYRGGMLDTVEHIYSDWWHRLSGIRHQPEHVVLVTVDDASLAERSDDPLVFWTPHFAKAVSTLRQVGASAIGVDFLFATSAESWIARQRLQPNKHLANYDLTFRQELNSGDVVLVGSRVRGIPPNPDSLLLPLPEYLLSLPDFDMLPFVGLADLASDVDGVIRRYEIGPSLNIPEDVRLGAPQIALGALLAIRASAQSPSASVWKFGDKMVSLTADQLISYAGPPGTLKRVPISRLLSPGALDDPQVMGLRGKVVIIGGDFHGMNDVHATPYSGSLSGVAGGLMTGPEIQANIVETLLSGRFTEEVPAGVRWLVSVLFLLSAMMAFRRLSPWGGLAALFLACAGILLLAVGLFQWYWLFPAAHLQFGMVAAYTMSYGRRLTSEERERARTRKLFQRYVSDNVVEMLLDSDRLPSLGGESATVSVLFSDIRNFTTISEKLEPHEVVEFLNRYFELVCAPILEQGGTIDKFIGDAVMVQFGAPLHYPDHAARALRAGVAMQKVASEFKDWMQHRFPGRNLPDFAIGIGIHSGEVVAGNVGSEKRTEYTVIGDTVNLASRLEGATKEFRCTMVASRETLNMAAGVVQTGRSDVIRVKGREAPVEIFEIVGLNGD
jgi:adenylate cyclase